MKKPIIIGITGGIGGGKTTLSNLLRNEGYAVYDSDKEAGRLQNEDPIIINSLVELFGNDIYSELGLNRKLVGTLVFGKPELLSKLNSIVHPVVIKDFLNWIESHNTHSILFIESAILFESKLNILVDKVILMTASQAVRIARVIKRDGISEEMVLARMKHQIPEESKIPLADFVIHSDDEKPLFEKMKKITTMLEGFSAL